MARFDLYRIRTGGQLVVNLQSDLIDHIDTRLVAPLMPLGTVTMKVGRLNPLIRNELGEFVLMTHLATAVKLRELDQLPAGHIVDEDVVSAAIDMLLFGF